MVRGRSRATNNTEGNPNTTTTIILTGPAKLKRLSMSVKGDELLPWNAGKFSWRWVFRDRGCYYHDLFTQKIVHFFHIFVHRSIERMLKYTRTSRYNYQFINLNLYFLIREECSLSSKNI